MHTASVASVSTTSSSKVLPVGLWIAQGLLAAVFLMSGFMKVSAPVDTLQAQMPWVAGSLGGLVRFIGVAELLGAIGVVLPALTRIKPMLTPLAASGLAVVTAWGLGSWRPARGRSCE